MITRQQITDLLQYRNGELLVTSCYLNLDRGQMPPATLRIRVKDLLLAAHQELARKAGTHAQRESLRADFDRIQEFVAEQIPLNRHKALALFACSGHKFFQSYGLPRLVRNILIADTTPYVRPLTAILAEYHRYGVALVDRLEARFFEVYMGEIRSRGAIRDDVPRRVREGGLGGRDERHIERRHLAVVQQHYRRVAGELFGLFRREQFDRLVLGGARDVLRAFKDQLHPYLRARWAGDFPADVPAATPATVLAETVAIEERLAAEKEQALVEELLAKAEAGRLAVAGVGETLDAVARGEAQTLLVDSAFEMPGYTCPTCRWPVLEATECPRCHRPTEPCADIVDEVVELALEKNCQIRHVHGHTPLRDAGRIGALLRYRA
jgi:peptide chain release factor subunit 1